MQRARYPVLVLWAALALAMGVGVLGRGYWTPDEPREADIAWRMSWQEDKSVPLLAGEAFCEKPPLTYWLAGGAMRMFGIAGWAARLPNLFYALVTALAVGTLARRSAGAMAGMAAAAAISTLLLSYQVAIWLATDAPLLAMDAVALLGLHVGFHAVTARDRLRGYSGMHAALALGFLSKSAAAWVAPVSTLVTLVVWEKRWRELLRWELYAGLALQAVLILGWVWVVYVGPDGPAHLKIFFWNNLVGRFARVDAPEPVQYATAHRNFPGKYLVELPVYLFPWTLLVLAAARRAWLARHASPALRRPVRFAIAAFLPTLGILSVAATARNIYLAPALPGLALLLAWWLSDRAADHGAWDFRALRATVVVLWIATGVLAMAAAVVGRDAWTGMTSRGLFVAVSSVGFGTAIACLVGAARAARRGRLLRGAFAALLAYCALLAGPVGQLYGPVDTWQDLAVIGRAVARDTAGRPLVLVAPDETTRAFVDMYAHRSPVAIAGPVGAAAVASLERTLAAAPDSLVMTQLAGRRESRTLSEIAARFGLLRQRPHDDLQADETPPWAAGAGLSIAHLYALPNGRRYALLRRRQL